MITGLFADLIFVVLVTFFSLTVFVPLFNLNDVPEFIEVNITMTTASEMNVNF